MSRAWDGRELGVSGPVGNGSGVDGPGAGGSGADRADADRADADRSGVGGTGVGGSGVGRTGADGAGFLVVGVGARGSATAPELLGLIRRALAEADPPGAPGTTGTTVALIATLAGKASHPAVRAAAAELGVPVAEHPADALAAVPVPHPSALVGAAVGAAGVAEAAALASAPGGELVVPKRKSPAATVAVARLPHHPATPSSPSSPSASSAPAGDLP